MKGWSQWRKGWLASYFIWVFCWGGWHWGEKLPWWWFPHRCSCPAELIYGYQMKSLIALSRTALLRNTRRLRIFFRFLRKIDAFENIIFLRINQGGRLPNRRHVTCLRHWYEWGTTDKLCVAIIRTDGAVHLSFRNIMFESTDIASRLPSVPKTNLSLETRWKVSVPS